MRSTKDELIKKGVLLPDLFDKDQDGKNGNLHFVHNGIKEILGHDRWWRRKTNGLKTGNLASIS